VAALVLALVAVPAGAARAADGLYLSWNDCPLGASTSQDQAFACDVNSGQHELVVSFSLPQPADSVLALEIAVDVQHADPTLPAWWQFGNVPCRGGSLHADNQFGSRAACQDLWQGLGVGGLQSFTVGQPRGGLNQARMRLALAVLFDDMRTLSAGAVYYAARIAIDNVATAGPGSCDGCAGAACLVLNSIMVGRPPGSPSGNVLVESPGSAGSNWATWQGGAGANCQSVPARRRTWGQVKSLYR
jgi:hypothetical protein